LDAARLAADAARLRLQKLKQPANDQAVAAANAAVAGAEAALKTAQAQLAEINARPTSVELQEADDRVSAAQAALDRAQAEPEPLQPEMDLRSFDVALAQRGLEQDQAQVSELEREIAAARVTAPFVGTVISVGVRPGTTVEAGRPVVVLGKTSDPVVIANALDSEAARLAAGQKATVELFDGDGTPHSASVIDLARGPGGTGTVARIRVSWGAARPDYGASARVHVVIQQKTDVLLVPPRAVHDVGNGQNVVDLLDGDVWRAAQVEVGIVSPDAVEIVSGLDEGQLVAVGR
jgi:macrolide-specific efflux system membrane fusion protein